MDDNIQMESCSGDSDYDGKAANVVSNGSSNGHESNVEKGISWRPSHILDFSDLSIG